MNHEPPCYRYHQIEAAMGNALVPVGKYQSAVLYQRDHEGDSDEDFQNPDMVRMYDAAVNFIAESDESILCQDDTLSMRDIESYKRLVIFCNRKQPVNH
jgi:hypothetical protein